MLQVDKTGFLCLITYAYIDKIGYDSHHTDFIMCTYMSLPNKQLANDQELICIEVMLPATQYLIYHGMQKYMMGTVGQEPQVSLCIRIFIYVSTDIKICDLLCQNPPLTHIMSKNCFHHQWIAPSISIN